MKNVMMILSQADKHWSKLDSTGLYFHMKALCFIIWKEECGEKVHLEDISDFLNMPCGRCPEDIVARLAFSSLVTYNENKEVMINWTFINSIET